MNQAMNDIHALNKDLITKVFQEILADQPTLLPTSNACQCHWIDPNKLRILLWKDQDTYILKIAEQKFVGVARSDRRGEVYWKFRELYESENKHSETKSPVSQVPTAKGPTEPIIEANKPLSLYSKAEIDRLAKFRERQAKAQSNEPQSLSADEYLAKLAQEKTQPAPENSQKQEALS